MVSVVCACNPHTPKMVALIGTPLAVRENLGVCVRVCVARGSCIATRASRGSRQC